MSATLAAQVRRMSAGRLTKPSDFELVAALQIENFAGLVRCRHLQAEAFDDLAGERYLLGIRCRHPAWRCPQRVFKPDADIAAHGGRHRRDRELIASGAEHR